MNSRVPSSGSTSQNSRQPPRTARAWLASRFLRQHRNLRRQRAPAARARIVVRGAVGARDRRVVGLVLDVVRRGVDLEDGRAGGGDRVEHPGQQGGEAAAVDGGMQVTPESSCRARIIATFRRRHGRCHRAASRQPSARPRPTGTRCAPSASTWTARCSTCASTTCSGSSRCRGAGASAHGVPAEVAIPQLRSRFDARRGTLEWYCIDHWSEELDFDIAALKHEMRAHIRYLPGALEFLDARARARQAAAAHDQRAPDQPRRQERRDRARAALRRTGLVARVRRAEGGGGVLGAARAAPRRGPGEHAVRRRQRRRARGGARGRRAAGVYQVLQPDSTQPLRAPLPGSRDPRARRPARRPTRAWHAVAAAAAAGAPPRRPPAPCRAAPAVAPRRHRRDGGGGASARVAVGARRCGAPAAGGRCARGRAAGRCRRAWRPVAGARRAARRAVRPRTVAPTPPRPPRPRSPPRPPPKPPRPPPPGPPKRRRSRAGTVISASRSSVSARAAGCGRCRPRCPAATARSPRSRG